MDNINTLEETSLDGDVEFWGPWTLHPLISIMESAGNSTSSRRGQDLFAKQYIISHLGPRPTKSPSTGRLLPHLDSFCCDDFSPVELTWNIAGMDNTTSRMAIRIGYEPIRRLAGTKVNPFNQNESKRAMSRLSAERGVNGQLWDYFQQHLL